MAIIDLQTAREHRTPHMRGTARCLGCQQAWEARVPVGVVQGLECPACHCDKGVLLGLMEAGTRFICHCGNDLYYVKPDGCECIHCGVLAQGF